MTAASTIEEAVDGVELIEEAVLEIIEIKGATLARISAANADRDHRLEHVDDLDHRARQARRAAASASSACTSATRRRSFPGVELIPHPTTDESKLDAVAALLRSAGKVPARVNDATGFVLNRLQYALFHEATQLVDEGVASPEDIDRIVRTTFGMRLPFFGPFAVADMAGLDVYAFCYRSLQTEFPERFATPRCCRRRSTGATSARRRARGSATSTPRASRSSSSTATAPT